MPLSFATVRVVLLFAMLSGSVCPAGSTLSAQEQVPVPKGKVLFERHDPAVESTPATQDTAPPADAPVQDATPATRTGVSSSQKRSRTTLHRRNPPQPGSATDTSALGTDPIPALVKVPAGVSSSAETADGTGPQGQPVLTADDFAAAEHISDVTRGSVTLTGRDLDFHLNAHTGAAEVRAQVVLRNTGSEPLLELPLRVSGALQWQSARLAGAPNPLPIRQYLLPDDLDHTGLAREIAVNLPAALQPGESVSLDLYYGGTIAASAQRLLSMGAPAGRALLTDWDTVTDTFTGLRGPGSVLWYPVVGVPALLRNGDAVTVAVKTGQAKDAGSRFGLQLTLEYSGSRPDAAFFCGERQPLVSLPGSSAPNGESGFVTAKWTRKHLGPHTPSLFIAAGAPQGDANGLLRVVTDRADTAAAIGEAAAHVRPMLTEWLGAAPGGTLDVIDLPIPGAAGFADGSLLVAPLTTAPAAVLAPSLIQPLASAWLPAEIASPWLRDGIPAFLQAVWVERTAGRTVALAGLSANAGILRAQSASASASYGSSSSQREADMPTPADPVATCSDPLCARNKAAYVFEMLRTMLGDAGLQQAFSGWAVQQSQLPGRPAAQETAGMETLLQQIAGKKDLAWFFQNWIDADRGLPDLRIVLVAPRRVERATAVISLPQARRPVAGPIGSEPVAPTDPRDMNERDAAALAAANGGSTGPAPGSWMVAVEVQNAGSADAEVPVTVRSGGLTNTLPLHIAAHSRATVRVPFEADPAEVLVNDGSVPEAETATHRKSIGGLPSAR